MRVKGRSVINTYKKSNRISLTMIYFCSWKLLNWSIVAPPNIQTFHEQKSIIGQKLKIVKVTWFCSFSALVVYMALLSISACFLPQNSRFVRNQWYYTIEQNHNTMHLAFVHPFETLWVLMGSFGTQHQRFCQNICQYFPYFWCFAPFNRPLY